MSRNAGNNRLHCVRITGAACLACEAELRLIRGTDFIPPLIIRRFKIVGLLNIRDHVKSSGFQ
jgi:hypothetical protein